MSLDADAVAGRLLAVDVDFQVALAHDRLGDHVARPVDRLERPLRCPCTRGRWSSRSGPNTLTPMSVRTPVESMSMRLMIGCVKMLLQPGTCKTRPISSSTRSPFGPALPRPEEHPLGERLLQFLPQGDERLRRPRASTPSLPSCASRPRRRSARRRAPCGAPLSRPALAAALATSSRASQVKALDAPVEQLPVDLALTRSRHSAIRCWLDRLRALRRRRSCRSAPSDFGHVAHQHGLERILACRSRAPAASSQGADVLSAARATSPG